MEVSWWQPCHHLQTDHICYCLNVFMSILHCEFTFSLMFLHGLSTVQMDVTANIEDDYVHLADICNRALLGALELVCNVMAWKRFIFSISYFWHYSLQLFMIRFSCSFHQQIMNHIVNMCPLTKFDGGLTRLMMMQPTGWTIWHWQHSQNEINIICCLICD